MMNKQEFQQKMKNMKRPKFFTAITINEAYEAGFEEAKNNALFDSCFLDEPEKPMLTKEEAEWVDKLTDVYDVPDALYYVTRCGYGYDLTFEICGKTYELPLEDGITYGELYKLKECLVNAVLYGYEVEKEKRYTVELPNPNRTNVSLVLGLYNDDKVAILAVFADSWKYEKRYKLTEEEIKKDFEWAWQFAEPEEVDE